MVAMALSNAESYFMASVYMELVKAPSVLYQLLSPLFLFWRSGECLIDSISGDISVAAGHGFPRLVHIRNMLQLSSLVHLSTPSLDNTFATSQLHLVMTHIDYQGNG